MKGSSGDRQHIAFHVGHGNADVVGACESGLSSVVCSHTQTPLGWRYPCSGFKFGLLSTLRRPEPLAMTSSMAPISAMFFVN